MMTGALVGCCEPPAGSAVTSSASVPFAFRGRDRAACPCASTVNSASSGVGLSARGA